MLSDVEEGNNRMLMWLTLLVTLWLLVLTL